MKRNSLLLFTTLISVFAFSGCKNEVSSSTSLITSSSTISSTISSTSNLVTYEMSVKTINGGVLKNVNVEIYEGTTLIETLKSDFYGETKITLTRGEYSAKLTNLPSGMYSDDIFALKEGEVNKLVCYAHPIAESLPANKLYNVGDLMYDFSFFNTESKKEKLSSLLENKEGVILNFWGTTCVPCQEEFPLFQQLYTSYSEDIEIIALSVEDSIKSVVNFKDDNDYTFKLGADLGGIVFKAFLGYFGNPSTGAYSIPGTVFIDKYGFINDMKSSSYISYGALESDCKSLINKY